VIVKMIVEKQMECRLAGETEVLGENLPQRPLLSITKSHITRPGFEPGPPLWEAGDEPPELWRGLHGVFLRVRSDQGMNEPRNRATLLLLSIQLHSLWFSFT
jgi:hypothetical protein